MKAEQKYYLLSPQKQKGPQRKYLGSGGQYYDDPNKGRLVTRSEAGRVSALWHEPLYTVTTDRTKKPPTQTLPEKHDPRGNYNISLPASYTDIVNRLVRKLGASKEDVLRQALELLEGSITF